MTNSRVVRARQSEEVVAAYYRDHGWPHAERVPASLPGRDVTGMPGLAPEVKARKGFDPLAWLKQAKRNAKGDVPYAILRCNGQGPESVGDWLVIRRLEDDTEILRLAGYGDDGHVITSKP